MKREYADETKIVEVVRNLDDNKFTGVHIPKKILNNNYHLEQLTEYCVQNDNYVHQYIITDGEFDTFSLGITISDIPSRGYDTKQYKLGVSSIIIAPHSLVFLLNKSILNKYFKQEYVEIIFDAFDKLMKQECSKNVYEGWYEYDDNGNLVLEKDSIGHKIIYSYDKNNNMIQYERILNGIKPITAINEYDANNNLIHFKYGDRLEEWYEYDDKGNQILLKYSTSEFTERYDYDDKNNKIHSKDCCDMEEWFTYDENNNLIYSKRSDGEEHWYKYDASNNLIQYKEDNDYETNYEYDENNNIIHYSANSIGQCEAYFKYDDKGNRIYKITYCNF